MSGHVTVSAVRGEKYAVLGLSNNWQCLLGRWPNCISMTEHHWPEPAIQPRQRNAARWLVSLSSHKMLQSDLSSEHEPQSSSDRLQTAYDYYWDGICFYIVSVLARRAFYSLIRNNNHYRLKQKTRVAWITLCSSFTGDAAEGEWSIDEATGKFQSSAEGNYWKIAFNEGVDLVEDTLKRNYREKISEEYTEYATRYDLTFLSPGYYQIRCKVS